MWKLSNEGQIRILAIDRPEAMNALNGEVAQGLIDALDAAAGESGVKVVVLTGTGAAFSAGADLDLLDSAETADRFMNLWRLHPPILWQGSLSYSRWVYESIGAHRDVSVISSHSDYYPSVLK